MESVPNLKGIGTQRRTPTTILTLRDQELAKELRLLLALVELLLMMALLLQLASLVRKAGQCTRFLS